MRCRIHGALIKGEGPDAEISSLRHVRSHNAPAFPTLNIWGRAKGEPSDHSLADLKG